MYLFYFSVSEHVRTSSSSSNRPFITIPEFAESTHCRTGDVTCLVFHHSHEESGVLTRLILFVFAGVTLVLTLFSILAVNQSCTWGDRGFLLGEECSRGFKLIHTLSVCSADILQLTGV